MNLNSTVFAVAMLIFPTMMVTHTSAQSLVKKVINKQHTKNTRQRLITASDEKIAASPAIDSGTGNWGFTAL